MKLEEVRGLWRGRTVACIASGPSLTQEDCDAVRAAGLPTIVVNTSFRLAPWADMIFAMDFAWWETYHKELSGVFSGQRWGYVRAPQFGVSPTKGEIYPTGYGNSGSYAISLAIVTKPMTIMLLGYDCQFSEGRKHWHADHPGKMGNAASIKRWPYQFSLVAKYAQSHGVRVLNCSRATALDCFERSNLEKELTGLGLHLFPGQGDSTAAGQDVPNVNPSEGPTDRQNSIAVHA